MGLFTSKGSSHIEGHKEYTLHSDVIRIDDKKVIGKIYIPIVGANGKEIILESGIDVGSEVKMWQKLGVAQGLYAPLFSPVSGKIIAKENRFNSLVGRPVAHLVIENDFKNTKAELLKTVTFDSSREEIIAAIKEAGIIGLGGAGFPTFKKYEGVNGLNTLLVNGCECEPYLTTDYENMTSNAELLIHGIELLKKAAGAEKVIIAFKKGKAQLKDVISATIQDKKDVSIFEVDDVYPIGWERTLVRAVLKKEYDRLPSEIGAVVQNAQTVMAVARALLYGKPITHRVITISGDGLNKSANVFVPYGTVASSIIEFLGGYKEEDVVILTGGPMCSKGQMNDQFVIERQTGGLTVLKHVETILQACLRCGACTLNCSAHLQPVEIKDAFEKKDVARIAALKADKCIECGMCSYVCPSKIEVTDFMRKAKLQLRIEAAKLAVKK